MRGVNYYILFLWVALVLSATNITGIFAQQRTLDVNFLKDGKLCNETILLDFINEQGNIVSPYIESVRFSILDSTNYIDNNPDRKQVYSTPVKLDFKKEIEPYSPEYYTAYTVYNINKTIEYYNSLFHNKIDFNSQKEYKNIEITLGDIPFLTSPKTYIFEENSNPSPSLFFHEIGHRAFWLLEDSLGIKFKGLSYVHMGLLEYFTVSLNNSPIVGEDALPSKMIRNASWIYGYPPADSLNIENMLKLLKDSYPHKIDDKESNIAKYYNVASNSYKDYYQRLDNHRGGMIIAGTLWRIRQKLGQNIVDKLVVETTLNLNAYMNQREQFYNIVSKTENLPDKIEWYDIYYGLLQKDKELNESKGQKIITEEFIRTGFNVDKVHIIDDK